MGDVEQPDRHSGAAVPQVVRAVSVQRATGVDGELYRVLLHGDSGGAGDAALGIQDRDGDGAVPIRGGDGAVLAGGGEREVCAVPGGSVRGWLRGVDPGDG